MQPVVFISDLHLHSSRPDITRLFFDFLADEARQTSALYILGDLFEFWIGDDDNRDDYRGVIEQLQVLTSSGTPVYFMRGNRDFLLGDIFAHKTGCILIEDPTVIELFGEKVLLMHGDTLCTDDTAYQAFRSEVRSAEWQNRVLDMPVDKRIDYFQSLRETSQKSIQDKAVDIMDVNQTAVETAMKDAAVLILIHGHTHRPHIHHFELDDQPARRIVLGDWYTQGSILWCDESGCRLEVRKYLPT